MTQRLYYTSDICEEQAQVISCLFNKEKNIYEIEINRTLFHPQGGGQPADKGTLNNISVLHVMQQQERIFHFTETPLPLGSQILMKLDKDLRYCHSAGHWPNEARIIFKPLGEVKIPDKVTLQKELSYWVFSDLPRWQKQEEGKRQVGFGDLFFIIVEELMLVLLVK